MSFDAGDGLERMRDKIQGIIDGLPNAVKDAVQESLDQGKDHSVEVVHVVTGRLRDSIKTENISEEGGDLVAGGGVVDYAAYEEFGNSRREGHPYLSPGFEVATRAMETNLKKHIDDLIR